MKKVLVCIFVITIVVIFSAVGSYLFLLPNLAKNPKVIAAVQKEVQKNLKVAIEIDIKEPFLKTTFSPDIEFGVGAFSLSEKGQNGKTPKTLVDIKNLDCKISYSQILKKKILINNLIFDDVFVDIKGLMKLAESMPKTEAQKSDWTVLPDESAEFLLKDLNLTYGEGIKISAKQVAPNKPFTLFMNKNKVLVVPNISHNGDFGIKLSAKNFNVKDAWKLMLIFPEAKEPLSYFKNVNGSGNFDFDIDNKGINGVIKFNPSKITLIPINNLPVNVQKGTITIDNKQILLKNFEGFYGKSSNNKAQLDGYVRDYSKNPDTKIEIKGRATNELAQNYISKLAGVKFEFLGEMPTKLTILSKNDTVDMDWIFYVQEGKDILLEGHSFSPTSYDRALKADFHLKGNIFKIKSIDYYIAKAMKRGMKISPIISISGNMDARDGKIYDMGFVITKPLPSEFLNLFAGKGAFKKGTISGDIKYVNVGDGKLFGRLEMEGVRIPSQKLSIKKGVMTTNENSILLDATGRFRRSNYKFDGDIKNSLALPVIVKNVDLSLDKINLEKLMNSLNQQKPQVETEEEGAIVFVPNMLVVEKCNFKLADGTYKQIEFGNLNAELTLDEKGNLNIKSNWFDFAKGISTLRLSADLVNNKFSIRLGAKNVDIDIVATAILAMEKQITGLASALLELNTDETFKLNGSIKFLVKDGAITQLGLVQYVLNAAALFRNPTLISPSTIFDLVNVPEGEFKTIDGVLKIKNNIITRMEIKSSSPQLASFISGRYNLETRDTSMRIYTKFGNKNKGLTEFLRNFSLNSLAKRIDFSNNNDESYYSTEIVKIPELETGEGTAQIFLTRVEGDVERNNFISSLKKIK